MQWAIEGGNINYRKGERIHHVLDADFSFTLQDFLSAKNKGDVALVLTYHEQEIRRTLLTFFTEALLTQIFNNQHCEVPGEVNFQSHIKAHQDAKHSFPAKGRPIAVRSNIQIEITIESDRTVTALQALFVARGNLASSLTDLVLGALRHEYMGIKKTHTKESLELKGNVVVNRSTSNMNQLPPN